MTSREQMLETLRGVVGVLNEALDNYSISYEYRVAFRISIDECRAAIARAEAEDAANAPSLTQECELPFADEFGGEG